MSKATPLWAKQQKIEEIYKTAVDKTTQTDILYDVDHIVPLISNKVCGLHCEANLQVMLHTENMLKSNKWWPDM